MFRCKLNLNLKFDYIKFDIIYLAIPQVLNAATMIFKKCCKGKDLLYTTGDRWRSWKKHYKKDVQQLLEKCISKFIKIFDKTGIELPSQQQFMPSTNTLIPRPIKRKFDLYIIMFARENTNILNKQIVS